ncbi:MAG: histidine phosphatase family protein [Stenotrophobium sp.]
MGQIYLVRHGQASFGAKDYDRLSELGAEQARLLGGWLGASGLSFSRAIAGSLRRHRQTAESCLSALPAALKLGGACETEPGFDEYDHDDVLLRSRPEFSEPGAVRQWITKIDRPQQLFQQLFDQAMRRWMGGGHDSDYREPWPAFRNRCVGTLSNLAEQMNGDGNVIVFTSGGPIAAICQHLLGFPDHQVAALTWTLVSSSAPKLLHRSGRVTLSTLNGHAHLEQSGRAQQVITYR